MLWIYENVIITKQNLLPNVKNGYFVWDISLFGKKNIRYAIVILTKPKAIMRQ
jgi:hypothetical protein